jgi:DNA invertase Pin-like site-specific DNA recombinase
MRTIGYARVSTREQAENSNALENQIARLKQEGVGEIYHDVISGSKFDRQAFELVMELVGSKQVDRVVFNELSRLGRTNLENLQIVKKFREVGVVCKILSPPIEVSEDNPWLDFQISMLSATAQLERDILIKRTKDGWQQTRNAGRAVSPPFGYLNLDNKYVLANRRSPSYEEFDAKRHDDCVCLLETKQILTKADLAKEVINTFLKERGLLATMRAIHKKYGIERQGKKEKGGNLLSRGYHWSQSGLSTWLRNPVLQGHTAYLKTKKGKTQDKEKWDIKLNTHPEQAIISAEQFEEIKLILDTNANSLRSTPTERKHAISGLPTCAICGFKMHTVNGKKLKNGFCHRYYQCRSFREGACSNQKLIRVEKLEAAIMEAIINHGSELEQNVAEANKELAARPKEVEAKMEELRNQLAGLEALGFNPAFEQAKQQIKNQMKILEGKTKLEVWTKEQATEMFKGLDVWQKLEKGELFTIESHYTLHKLIKAVWVRDGEVEEVEFTG